MREFLLKNRSIIAITLLFGIIYSLISIVNHYNFRTNAGDLGIYNQAIYDYAHFKVNYNTVWYGARIENMLSDHFTIVQLLISPLYWVFGSYTLLIIQIVAILFAGIGIYKYIKLISKNEKLSLFAAVHFFSMWGIYSALNFDYHDNVLAATFVVWFIYFLKKSNYFLSTVFFILIILCKENMILWASFLALGLLLVNFKDLKKRYYLIFLTVFSLVFFILVLNVIMPSLTLHNVKGYNHFDFSVLGENMGEAVKNIFRKPIEIFIAFFTNHTNNPSAVGIKNEFFLVFILSGGLIVLRKPQYLIALIPVFGQKLFHDYHSHWGLTAHYSIEFAPIISIALFEYFSEHQNKHILKLAFFATLSCFTINIIKINDRLPGWYDNTGVAFYSKKHYETQYSVKELNDALKKIPEDAIVSAESNIVPHLANRRNIYMFPAVFDADYVVFCKDNRYYPKTKKQFNLYTERLLSSYRWETVVNNSSVFLFKKNINAKPSENEIRKEEERIKNNKYQFDFIKNKAISEGKLNSEVIRAQALTLLEKESECIFKTFKIGNNQELSTIINAIITKEVVIIAVNDEASKQLPKFFAKELDKNYKTTISQLKYRESYIAIFNDGKLIFEERGFKKIHFEGNISRVFAEVLSVGGVENKKAVASIKLNDIEYSINKRGLNVVSADFEENVIVYHFDTFKNRFSK